MDADGKGEEKMSVFARASIYMACWYALKTCATTLYTSFSSWHVGE